MNQAKYALLVALPLFEGGHVVVDADEIAYIFDGKPSADESSKCWLFMGDDRRFELDGAAKDLLKSINDQRFNTLADFSHASNANRL